MSTDTADLASVLDQIELLTGRVSASADRHEAAGADVIANDLYDVERALRTASRRLEAAIRKLD
jgi:hypothetical protein